MLALSGYQAGMAEDMERTISSPLTLQIENAILNVVE